MQSLKLQKDKIHTNFTQTINVTFHITNLTIDSKLKEYFEKFNGTISFYYNNREYNLVVHI